MENFELERLQLVCSTLSDHRVLQLRQEVEALKKLLELKLHYDSNSQVLTIESHISCVNIYATWLPSYKSECQHLIDMSELNRGSWYDYTWDVKYTVENEHVTIEHQDRDDSGCYQLIKVPVQSFVNLMKEYMDSW